MADQELFTGTASCYAKYRPGYPQAFFDHLIEVFKLDGEGRLLDLGCGTGQIAIPLAPRFAEVVGVDPEQEMLDEAKKAATQVNNVQWLCMRAEDISPALGKFRLTTMGRSFHWIEQALVLEKLYAITEKGGGVAIVTDSSSPWRTATQEGWENIRKATIQKYLGQERRAGNSLYKAPAVLFETQLKESPFGGYDEWLYDHERSWTVDTIIGHLYSTSFASRRLFGDEVEAFEKDLREELLKLEPSGIFNEKVQLQALIAQK